MRTVSIQAKNMTSNKRIIALIVLLLLSSIGMFGQETKNEIVMPVVVKTVSVAAATSSTTAQMELVSWFMGSKQLQMSNSTSTIGTTSTNNSGKKQFINLGMTPNRILSRTLLKKAINHESTIA